MEDKASCEICSLEFSATEKIPRVLDCGHSFCTSCITQLIIPTCPKCRANILVGREFPVNYSLLNLIEECKSEKGLSEHIVSSIDNLREKLNSKLLIINKISEICSKKEAIETDILLLNSMKEENLNEEYGNKNEMRIQKKLRKLQEKYQNFSLVNYLYFDDLDQFSNFSLQNSETKEEFLEEIYKALKNSEKVFSFKCIEKKLKFGELTVRDNKILIHSLSLDEIPKGSKIVQFADLRCTKIKPYSSFFEISGKKSITYTFIIHFLNASFVPRFIKMCTADEGSTYKNLPFYKGENRNVNENVQSTDNHGRTTIKQRLTITLESIVEVNILEDLQPDYYKNHESTVECAENDVIVTEKNNDGFQVFRVKRSGSYSILGKVNPTDFWNYLTYDETSKILDCGLVMEL